MSVHQENPGPLGVGFLALWRDWQALCHTGFMAREVIIRTTDDLDPTKLADETRDLTFEGVTYTLDLTRTNLEKLRKLLAPWLEAAHEKKRQSKRPGTPRWTDVPRGTSPSTRYKASKPERDKIRTWARNNGLATGDKGVIATHIVEAYKMAHEGGTVTRREVAHGKIKSEAKSAAS